MSPSAEQSVIEQLRRLIKDAIDYFQSVVALLQARVAEMALSGFLFILIMSAAALLGLASFLLFNVALGLWIAYMLNGFWAVLILGTLYAILAFICGKAAMRWLNQLRS